MDFALLYLHRLDIVKKCDLICVFAVEVARWSLICVFTLKRHLGEARKRQKNSYASVFLARTARRSLRANLRAKRDLSLQPVFYRSKCAPELHGELKKRILIAKIRIERAGPFRSRIYGSNSTSRSAQENTYPNALFQPLSTFSMPLGRLTA